MQLLCYKYSLPKPKTYKNLIFLTYFVSAQKLELQFYFKTFKNKNANY